MILKWIDKRSVLKVGKEFYKAGDIVPAEELTEKRIELFVSLGQLERVTPCEEKPKRKSRKKKKKLDDTGTTEETSGPSSKKPEESEGIENAGPKE